MTKDLKNVNAKVRGMS